MISYRHLIKSICILGLLSGSALFAQWQPIPEDDITLTGIAPAVRADTSVKADGRVVDQDTLAARVYIEHSGYYRILPQVWLDSGNEQRNESYYLTIHKDNEVYYPLDPNAGQYRIVPDDTVKYTGFDLYFETDAGLWYLEAGMNDIWLHHYAKIAEQYPQFINYYPDGRGIHGSESIYIWEYIIIKPEPKVDGAVHLVFTDLDTCIYNDIKRPVVAAGDTFHFDVVAQNMQTGYFRNGLPSATMLLNIPANIQPIDFSIFPDDVGIPGSNAYRWEITQLRDSTISHVPIQIQAIALQEIENASSLDFNAEFVVPNDLDNSNNSDAKSIFPATPAGCPTDLSIELFSTDTDRYVLPGDTIFYKTVITNLGENPAFNVDLDITLDSKLVISSLPAGLSFQDANTLTTLYSEVAVGMVDTLTFSAIVNRNLNPEGTIYNQAVIQTAFDSNQANNQDDDLLNIGFPGFADLKVAQVLQTDSLHIADSDMQNWASVDSTFKIQLVVTNQSAVNAYNITLADTLPEFVRAQGFANERITWDFPQLAAGASQVVELTCFFTDKTLLNGYEQINRAGVLCENEDVTRLSDNYSRASVFAYKYIPPVEYADMAIDLSVSGDSLFIAGDDTLAAGILSRPFTFTLQVKNNGPYPAQNIRIAQAIPTGLQNKMFTIQPSIEKADSVIWQIPALAVGNSWQVDWSCTHESGIIVPKLLSSTAIVSSKLDVNDQNNKDTVLYMLVEEPVRYADLAVMQTAQTDSVLLDGQAPLNFVTNNENFSYRVVVKNNGNDTAENVVIIDSLAAELGYNSSAPQAQVIGKQLFWNVNNLASHDSLVFTVNCQVPAPIFVDNYPFVNTASAETSSEPDSLKKDNRSQLPVFYYNAVPQYSDLAVRQSVKTDSVQGNLDMVTNNNVLTFDIVVKNNGTTTAQSVILSDTLADGLIFLSSSPAAQSSNNIINWSLNNIAVGDSLKIQMICELDDSIYAEGQTFSANTGARAANEPDSLLADNNASNTLYYYHQNVQVPDLAITQSALTDSFLVAGNTRFDFVTQNETFTLKLHLKNHGTTTATNIQLTDALPTGISLLNAAPIGTLHNTDWVWNFAELESGDSLTITLTCRVVDQTFPTNHAFTSLANVQAANEPDTLLTDNASQHNVFYYPTQISSFNVSIRQTVLTDSILVSGATVLPFVKKNEVFLINLWVKNEGTPAQNVVLSNTLPAGITLVQAVPQAQINNTTASWQLGTLIGGDSTQVQLVCQVNDADFAANHPFVNNASVTATDEPADMLLDNHSTLTVFYYSKVEQNCDLALTQTAQTDSVSGQLHFVSKDETFFYTLNVTNIGQATALNVVVHDTLPDGLSFVSANPTASVNGNILTWNVGTLVAGAGTVLAVQCQVQSEGKTQFTNKAVAFSSCEPANLLANNQSEFTVYYYQHIINYDLQVLYTISTDSSFAIGGKSLPAMEKQEQVLFTIQVKNNGPVRAENISLVNTLPQTLSMLSPSIPVGFASANVFSWNIAVLNSGQSWQVTYQSNFSGSDPLPMLLNAEAVLQAANDSNDSNNFATVELVVYEKIKLPKFCDVWITQTAQTDSVVTADSDSTFYTQVGEPFAYVLKIGNQAAYPAGQVEIKSALPENADYVDAQPTPTRVTADSIVWNMAQLNENTRLLLYMSAQDGLPIGKNFITNTAIISAVNEDPMKLQNNQSVYSVINFIPVPDPLIVEILVDPAQIDVTDSATVQVRFSQRVKTWDLSITMPDGSKITDFGDAFIEKTDVEPNIWYTIDQRYIHEKLTGANVIDELLFTVEATSIWDFFAIGQDELTVVSSEDMILDRNVYRVGLDNPIEIRFKLPGGTDCVLSAYDLAGHKICDICKSFYSGGWNVYAWDGRTEDGSYAGSGTYLVTLHHVYGNHYKKLIIVR